MSRRILVLFALICAPYLALAQAPGVRASLDRTDVGVGETVTLNIEADASVDIDSPDLTPLGTDFVVLGTQVSRSLSVVNGQRRARAVLGIALRPRHEGHITVPALTIGGQRTPALELNVDATDPNAPARSNATVFLDVKTDTTHAYVGQQIDYTLRLYYGVRLADGTLGDPGADGTDIRRVGQDVTFQTQRGGRTFNVIERHYAIMPQRAGTLQIGPPTFQGTAVDAEDPGAFFGAGTPVNAVGQPQKIEISAKPATAGEGAWLPARELTLNIGGWPQDGKAGVGQPVTLTMRLQATGIPFEALPALSLPPIDGADVYPDKPNTGGANSGPWITGWREQGFAVVPSRAGTLHIPETTLHWWNVQTDRLETARIPAHDLEVTGGAAAAPTSVAPAHTGTVAPPVAVAPSASGFPWRWLFLGALGLWALTMLAWFVTARRRPAPASGGKPASAPVRDHGKRREAFVATTHGEDLAAQESTLLAWARVAHPELRSLGALLPLLGDGAQRDAVAALQRARFGGGTVDGAALRAAFAQGFVWIVDTVSKSDDPLPPLYPR
ncbi:oxygen tolerance protein BatD [Luteibacter rhizovicinus]|uniref:Oxygen tolerance protein BatD n=1 Tax=Luteibacter rhizovicinus TaxID=242606 RepID=A0A4R3YSN2_9GAMM|nr:BatD family protein [Luteibacter rhizovicinus]TCV96005.1 oxygen tolerance protein BatD [Luteibacter rhizovicinus]